MKYLNYIFLVLCILFGCTQVNNSPKKIENTQQERVHQEKTFDEKIQELVLSENKVGQEYFFKVMLKNEVLEYRITYLGIIKTSQGDSLKFIISIVYSGLYEDSKRANC